MQLETVELHRQPRVGMGEVLGDILLDVGAPPAEEEKAVKGPTMRLVLVKKLDIGLIISLDY